MTSRNERGKGRGDGGGGGGGGGSSEDMNIFKKKILEPLINFFSSFFSFKNSAKKEAARTPAAAEVPVAVTSSAAATLTLVRSRDCNGGSLMILIRISLISRD